MADTEGTDRLETETATMLNKNTTTGTVSAADVTTINLNPTPYSERDAQEQDDRISDPPPPGVGSDPDLTQLDYDERRTLRSTSKQRPNSPASSSSKSTSANQITIDYSGMVRVDGQELIQLMEESVPVPVHEVNPTSMMETADCVEEQKVIHVIIEQIELEGNSSNTSKHEGRVGEGENAEASGETETETDSESEEEEDPFGGSQDQKGQQHVVIYLNSSTASKKQIQVNKCELCDLLFGSRSLLYKHYAKVHLTISRRKSPSTSASSKKPPPEAADEFVVDPSAMVEEIGPKQYKCRAEKCGRLFKRSFDVVRHYDCIHNGSTVGGVHAYACSACGKGFTRKDNLQRHERTHDTNRKLFWCKSCNKPFTRQTDTIRHFEVVHNKVDKVGGSSVVNKS